MVTANILREVWRAIVLAHKDGVTFTSEWSEVLDTDTSKHLPNVKWMPPTVQVTEQGDIVRTSFTCAMFFEDNHEADRTTGTRDDVYERMQVVAAQCLLMFRQMFVHDETKWEGVPVNVRQEGAASFNAAFDTPGTQITGCSLTVTFYTDNQLCVDGYFNPIP